MTMQPNNFNPSTTEANQNTSDHLRHRRMLEPLLSLYEDGEASAAERQTVERYLATCQECRNLLAGYNQVTSRLRVYLQGTSAPRPLKSFNSQGRSVKTSTLPSLFSEPRLSPVNSATRLTPVRAGRMAGAAAALLLVVALLALVWTYRNGTADQLANTAVAVVGSPSPLENIPTPTFSPLPTATFSPRPTTVVASSIPIEAAQPPATAAALPSAAPDSPLPVVPSNTPRPAPPTVTSVSASRPTIAPVVPTATAAVPPTSAITSNTAQGPTPTATVVLNTAIALDTPVSATPSPTTITTAVPTTTSSATAVPTLTPGEATSSPTTTTATATASPGFTPTALSSPTATTPRGVASPGSATTLATSPALATSSPTPLTVSAPGWIAYVSTQDGEIYLSSSDGTNQVALSKDSAGNGVKWEQLVWSHDGQWIMAVGQNVSTAAMGIYQFNVSELNHSKLEFIAEGMSPVWSPNDLSIAYLAGPLKTKDGLKSGKPSLITLKKRNLQAPTILSEEYQTLAPQWFEESNRLLIGQNSIVAPDGTPLNTFDLPFDNNCAAASLSPFGNKLAVLEPKGLTIYDLSRGSLDKNKPLTRLAVNPPGKIGTRCGAYRLNWTPSGRSLYFYVNGGNADLTCVVSASGAGSDCLNGVYAPSFTADGSYLADYNPNARGQVYAIAYGSKSANSKVLAFSKVAPVWQPRRS